jgi:hypothetical protein
MEEERTTSMPVLRPGFFCSRALKCPPLATTWVYAIVQLDLPYATLSLAVVGVYTWLSGLSLVR